VDLSLLLRANFSQLASSVRHSYEITRLHYTSHSGLKNIPFPAGTRGFLYYLTPHDLPDPARSIAGQVRFRLTTSHLPESFAGGVDLSQPDGLPWCIPLHHIAHSSNMKALLRKLTTRTKGVDPPLVSKDTIERCKRLFDPGKLYKRTLYSLGQPFPVKLNATSVDLFIVPSKCDRLIPLTILAEFLGPYQVSKSHPKGL
jgi:hypothetical protein